MRKQWIPGPFLRFFEWAWVRSYDSCSVLSATLQSSAFFVVPDKDCDVAVETNLSGESLSNLVH